MSGFAAFRANPALEAMLALGGYRFTEADRRCLEESLRTIRAAMVQPVGATPQARRRDLRCVTDVEFDGAVTRALSAAMVLWLSGRLGEVECDG